MAALPDCFDCKYGGGEFPCRTADGRFDFAKAAAAMIAYGRLFSDRRREDQDEPVEAPDDIAWIADCEYEVTQDHPDLLLPLIVAAADACETRADAAYLAAGTIENALVKHGPELIGGIEAIAKNSAKFRYLLSGAWSQSGSVNADVWQRLAAAIGTSGRIDADRRTASAQSGGPVLKDAEVTELLKDRVTEAAAGVVKY
jgi:hypothetical protein